MASDMLTKQKNTYLALLSRTLLNASVVVALLCAQGKLFAQQANALSTANTATQADIPQESAIKPKAVAQEPLDITVASDGNVSATGDILRLEETIRGNKEQPKVLSIVPWQLPLHQRIDRNEQRWAPIATKLKPLERNSFLKEIKLLEGIQNKQSSAQVDTQSN